MGPSETRTAGEVLVAGASLTAPAQGFSAWMLEDGDLVVHDSHGTVIWSAGTHGHPAATAVMEDDGELVVRSGDGRRLWGSGTAGHPGAFVQLHDDGRLVVHDFYRHELWSSAGEPGRTLRDSLRRGRASR